MAEGILEGLFSCWPDDYVTGASGSERVSEVTEATGMASDRGCLPVDKLTPSADKLERRLSTVNANEGIASVSIRPDRNITKHLFVVI